MFICICILGIRYLIIINHLGCLQSDWASSSLWRISSSRWSPQILVHGSLVRLPRLFSHRSAFSSSSFFDPSSFLVTIYWSHQQHDQGCETGKTRDQGNLTRQDCLTSHRSCYPALFRSCPVWWCSSSLLRLPGKFSSSELIGPLPSNWRQFLRVQMFTIAL